MFRTMIGSKQFQGSGVPAVRHTVITYCVPLRCCNFFHFSTCRCTTLALYALPSRACPRYLGTLPPESGGVAVPGLLGDSSLKNTQPWLPRQCEHSLLDILGFESGFP